MSDEKRTDGSSLDPMPERTDFPDHPRAVSAQWLTEVLRNQGVISRAAVRAIQIDPMPGAAGNAQMSRFRLAYSNPEQGAPRSLIGKFANADRTVRDLLNDLGVYERESRFYAQSGSAPEVPIPGCYYSAVNRKTGATILLLEDLSYLRTIDIVAGAGPSASEDVIRALAALHAHWWEGPQGNTLSWLPAFEQNVLFFREKFQACWQVFLAQLPTLLPDYRLPPSMLEVGQRLDQHLDTLCNHYSISPRTSIHCDAHLDNILFGAAVDHPPVIVLDWQIAAQGKGVLDVAYFLIRSVPPEQRRRTERDLVETYHGLLGQMGVEGYDFDQCWADYRRAFFWPFLSTVISIGLGDPTFIQNPVRFRVTVQRLAAFVDHHSVRALLPT